MTSLLLLTLTQDFLYWGDGGSPPKKGLNCQNHSSGSLQPVNPPTSKISDPPTHGGNYPTPTPYRSLENLVNIALINL